MVDKITEFESSVDCKAGAMRTLLLITFYLLGTLVVYGQKPKLYVFLPSTQRPAAMQNSLSRACPDLDIAVMGRQKEFLDAVEESPPDGILTLAPVLDNADATGYRRVLLGSKQGITTEDYFLLKIKGTDKQASAMKIGVVKILSRGDMSSFIKGCLGGVEPSRLSYVTKLEDLLTVLQFRTVDAIFVPESLIDSYYRKRSKMNLVPVSVDKPQVGLAVLAVKGGNQQVVDTLIKSIEGLDIENNKKLGLDGWQRSN